MKSDLYFECHVTVEPVYEEKLNKFIEICTKHKFRVAKLLMQQRKTDTPERSNKDAFCTSRDVQYEKIFDNMKNLIAELQLNDFKVWRYKIEDTLLDSKIEDKLSFLL